MDGDQAPVRLPARVHCEWGMAAIEQAAMRTAPTAIVIVDVLSFSTSVSVATDLGTAVYPCDLDPDRAAALADSVDARLAVPRTQVTPQRPWSLSPAALARAPAVERLVLASPNGSALSAAAGRRPDAVVLAGCLRNASAVGHWVQRWCSDDDRRQLLVVPAGERWPDGTLRPALEDLLGAAAILDAVATGGSLDDTAWTPEAEVTRDLATRYSAERERRNLVRRSASGVELAEDGFFDDVELATRPDASHGVPLLHDGAFRRVTTAATRSVDRV